MFFCVARDISNTIIAVWISPRSGLASTTTLQTINAAIDLHATSQALSCVSNSIATLPNVDVALDFLASASGSLGAIQLAVVALSQNVTALDEQKTEFIGHIDIVSDHLSAAEDAISGVRTAIGAAEAAVATLAGHTDALLHPTTGTLVTAREQLGALNYQPSPGAVLPAPEALVQAAGVSNANEAPPGVPATVGDTGTLLRLISGSMAQQPSEAGVLRDRLSALRAVLNNDRPNFAGTAQLLGSVNTAINEITQGGSLEAVSDALEAVDAAAATLPPLATVQAAIDALWLAANSIDVVSLTYYLQQLNEAIDVSNSKVWIAVVLPGVFHGVMAQARNVPLATHSSTTLDWLPYVLAATCARVQMLPAFDGVLAEVRKVQQLPALVDCLLVMQAQLTTINATVAVLPDDVSMVADIVNMANATIQDAIRQAGSIEAAILDANATVHSADVAAYEAQIMDADTTLAQRRDAINVDALKTQLESMGASTTFDFADATTSLASLEAQLAGAAVSSSVITALSDLHDTLETLDASLRDVISDLGAFQQGYCSNDASKICTSSDLSACQDAGASCLGEATYRCALAQTTACTANSNCPAGDYCLIDPTRREWPPPNMCKAGAFRVVTHAVHAYSRLSLHPRGPSMPLTSAVPTTRACSCGASHHAARAGRQR